MKNNSKKARWLHDASREYRGAKRVADFKTRASRIERRINKIAVHKGIES